MESKFSKDNLIARWLDNRLTDDEKIALDKSGELDDLKVVIDDIDTWKVENFDVEKGLENLKERKKMVISPTTPNPKSKLENNWLRIAASIVIFISVAFFALNYFLNTNTVIETTVAENKNITLSDGSIIKLDALSSISYQEKNWNANRNIVLTGQAFFEVTKGSTFKVTTATGSVEVLGTQFNVNVANNAFEVKCFEGKVKVNYSKASEILTKGQVAVATQNTLLKSTINTNKPNWMNGFSKYNKSKLMVVINDLQKYYNTTITLPKKYHNLEFTGTIMHKNLNKALQTLSTSMEIEYTVDDNNNVTFQ